MKTTKARKRKRTARPGYREEEQEAVDYLLDGIPAQGGHTSRYWLERVVRAAFRGGVVAVKTEGLKNEHEAN